MSKLSELKNQLDDLYTTHNDLSHEKETCERRIDELDEQLDCIDEEVSVIQSKINKLTGGSHE